MEERSLDKALDIYSALITGQEVSRSNQDTRDMYEEYYSNSAVYDITNRLVKKLNLNIYEYNDSIYVTAGEGNRVFGYTNEDMKRQLGLRLNKELYMVYFIMYNALLSFYQDSASYQVKEYVKLEEMMESVSSYLMAITKDLSVYSMDDLEADSFKTIALLWDELPAVTSDDKDKNRASRASRTGYVKLTFNFLIAQKLFVEVEDRYYPTDRFKALVENYFEEYKGRIYKALGGEVDA
ncbi:MAG: hypothetical protein IKL53_01755 [Lachnospiraceae bacterium]|nr:hypothetical protein [Lachnospiraceae bacterium]MBR3598582.1 hypothetical protein [Lachnospiraceae bacterium]